MAIRDQLLTTLDAALAASSVAVSTELPFDQSGVPLYAKNMKKLYIDKDNLTRDPLIETLDFNPVESVITTVTAYLTVDAKNPVSDIDTITAVIVNSKNSIPNQITRNCDVTTEYDNDQLIYTFDFEFASI